MDHKYTAFFSSVHLSVDRIEIIIDDARTVEQLLNDDKEFTRSSIFTKEFRCVPYTWIKYKHKSKVVYLLIPKPCSTDNFTKVSAKRCPENYYKPRLLLCQPTIHTQQRIVEVLLGTYDLYFKVTQLEIALDFMFKEDSMAAYVEDIIKQIDSSLYTKWGRKSKSFGYGKKDTMLTTYRVNSDVKNKRLCTKPITMYSKVIQGKEVLRVELMLNKSSADVQLPFVIDNDTIFKYITFYNHKFNVRNFAKLMSRIKKRGADINKIKRLTNNFVNRSTYTINDKVLKLKKILKEHVPGYNGTKSVSNCLEINTELTSFIVNNLSIKGM